VVFPVTLADTDRAKSLVASSKMIGIRDALHAAVMLNNNVERIATFDDAFDAIDHITRERL
jgi:predicted nucleic acid-binding protein